MLLDRLNELSLEENKNVEIKKYRSFAVLYFQILWGWVRGKSPEEQFNPFPSPGPLPDLGIEPQSPAFAVVSLLSEPPGKPHPKIYIYIYIYIYTY